MREQAQYINIKGMNQDLSISKFNPEFIYSGYNIRINQGSTNSNSADEGNNLYSITNEKGNKKINLY
jgi:hypothetical protein